MYSQVLKRLKKVQPEGYSRHDSASECSIHSNEAKESASSKGTITHISTKYKKMGNEEVVSEHLDYDLNHEPMPQENGPKRLKIKGPSVIGLDNTTSFWTLIS